MSQVNEYVGPEPNSITMTPKYNVAKTMTGLAHTLDLETQLHELDRCDFVKCGFN